MAGAYVDCFAGAAGDMLLGALVDAGAPLDELRAALASLPVAGWRMEAETVTQGGLRGTRLQVHLDGAFRQPTRTLADVQAIVRRGRLPEGVQHAALGVFRALAQVEARVHGTTPEEVHFHEVGAVDAIVDVVGVCLGLHLLDVQPGLLFASGLPLGSGWARGEHGPVPLPGPATLELLRLAAAPTRQPPRPDAEGELVTPTGAALLTSLARFRQPVFERVERVGYGFGTRQPAWPNAVRVLVGELQAPPDALLQDEVEQLETHLDDATPEQLGFAMERLLEAGALDVAFAPLQMKKNRPGVLLRVLAPAGRAEEMAALVLLHTPALGVRAQRLGRYLAAREVRTVHTAWGPVRVKVKRLAGRTVAAPEYDDCAALARSAGVPLLEVYAAAQAAAGDGTAGEPSGGS